MRTETAHGRVARGTMCAWERLLSVGVGRKRHVNLGQLAPVAENMTVTFGPAEVKDFYLFLNCGSCLMFLCSPDCFEPFTYGSAQPRPPEDTSRRQ